MKVGDIVVYNGNLGKVVESGNDFKFFPCNHGR